MRRNTFADKMGAMRSTAAIRTLTREIARRLGASCRKLVAVRAVPHSALMAVALGIGASGYAEEAPDAMAPLKSELANVRRELALLRAHAAPSVLGNSGFETQQTNGPEGWQFQPVAGGEANIDAETAFEGQHSVHLSNQGATTAADRVVTLRSAPFQLPATRRVAVTAWMRTDPQAAPPTVWLVLEGKYNGQPFSHHVEVGGASPTGGLAPLGAEWAPVTLQLDELPMDGGITDLITGVDLRGQGEVWVDSIQLTDMWLNDTEQRALMGKLDTAEAHLAAGQFEQMRHVMEVELPKTLAGFAPSEYLAPSLSKATIALADAAKASAETQVTVGKAVNAVAANAASVAAAVDAAGSSAPLAKQSPITPIGQDKPPVAATAALQNAPPATDSKDASRPTVLASRTYVPPAAPSANVSTGAESLHTKSVVVARTSSPVSTGVPASVSTVPASTTLAAGATPVVSTAAEEQPWWKFWRNESDATDSRAVARSMPGAQYYQRRSPTNAAQAASPVASEDTVSLPKSAFRRLRDRFQGEESTVVATTAEPAMTAADTENERSILSRFRLPFTSSNDEASTVATQATTENERRFSLFGLGRNGTTDSTGTVAGNGSTVVASDPFVTPVAQQQVQGVPATDAEAKESRLASIRKLFRLDDESQTVTK